MKGYRTMEKIKKGNPGYISSRKKAVILRTVIYFCIAAAVFAAGYFITKTWLGIPTAAAVLLCIPAVISLFRLISWIPYRSADAQTVSDLSEKASHLTVCYDLILKNDGNLISVDSVAISGNTLFGYTRSKKAAPEEIAEYMKALLSKNGFDGFTVRILSEYNAFLARAEGLDHIAAVEKADTGYEDRKIRRILLKNAL